MKRDKPLSVRLRGSESPTTIPLSEAELRALQAAADQVGLPRAHLVRECLAHAALSSDYARFVGSANLCGLTLPEWARVVLLASIGFSPLEGHISQGSTWYRGVT